MRYISTPSRTKEILEQFGLKAKKGYGQNFLVDPVIVEKCAMLAHCEGAVIEVGPGIGSLTEQLARYATYVRAYEIDEGLLPVLQETLKDYKNVDVILQDFLAVHLDTEVKQLKNKYGSVAVCANLPYYITTPVLFKIFECPEIEYITVMVQKEVASRIMAEPGVDNYGAITLAVRYYAEPELAANVPPNCFMPRPTVGSAVLNLRCFGDRKPVRPKDETLMFALIKAAFGQRRKTLVNSLEHGTSLGLTKENIRSAILRLGLSENVRGEELSLKQFSELSDIILQS